MKPWLKMCNIIAVALAFVTSANSQTIESLEEKSLDVANDFVHAQVYTAQSLEKVAKALKMDKEALQLQGVIKSATAKNGKSQDSIKSRSEVINNVTKKISSLDSNAAIDKKVARSNFAGAIVDLGVGSLMFGSASVKAKGVSDDGTAMIKQCSLFELTKMNRIRETVSIDNYVISNTPGLLSDIKSASGFLADYCKQKGLPVPTQKEIENKAKKFVKG